MLSSPVCDLAPELQTSEIQEGFMKHLYISVLERLVLQQIKAFNWSRGSTWSKDIKATYWAIARSDFDPRYNKCHNKCFGTRDKDLLVRS
jgi:hypothetical protein